MHGKGQEHAPDFNCKVSRAPDRISDRIRHVVGVEVYSISVAVSAFFAGLLGRICDRALGRPSDTASSPLCRPRSGHRTPRNRLYLIFRSRSLAFRHDGTPHRSSSMAASVCTGRHTRAPDGWNSTGGRSLLASERRPHRRHRRLSLCREHSRCNRRSSVEFLRFPAVVRCTRNRIRCSNPQFCVRCNSVLLESPLSRKATRTRPSRTTNFPATGAHSSNPLRARRCHRSRLRSRMVSGHHPILNHPHLRLLHRPRNVPRRPRRGKCPVRPFRGQGHQPLGASSDF
jgi:hypothetical protein